MVMRYAHHDTESLREFIEVMNRFERTSATNQSQPQKNRGYEPYPKPVNP
jgi:hypothetical protein